MVQSWFLFQQDNLGTWVTCITQDTRQRGFSFGLLA